MSTRPTYTLTLAPEPGDDIPPSTRLRSALKTLLRTHRLRCVRVEETPPAGTPDPATGDDGRRGLVNIKTDTTP